MIVLRDRQRQAVAEAIRLKAVIAFHDVPAVILASLARLGLEIDLLPGFLPDIRDVQIAGGAIERESPGIAQAVGPDLIPERIRSRNTIRRIAGFHIDAKQLAQQRGAVLAAL